MNCVVCAVEARADPGARHSRQLDPLYTFIITVLTPVSAAQPAFWLYIYVTLAPHHASTPGPTI
jgi:hypothetical protein